MTGAACLWVWVAIFFAIPVVFGFCMIVYKTIDETISWKAALSGLAIILLASIGCFGSAWQCQKCYDVNFAVAMKNIQYTRTTEVNTNIEMNYQDVESMKKSK